MPETPEELLREAVEAVRQYGSQRAASRALGIPRSTIQSRVQKAEAKGLHLSKGFQDAIAQTRTHPGEVKHGWIKEVDPETGRGVSLFVKNEVTPEDYADRLRDVFSEPLPPAEPVSPPEMVEADLCAVHPLMDVHLAMHAWPDETGAQGYSLDEALHDLRVATAKIDTMTPPAAKGILLIGGDFFHADDETGLTPKSKHSLDVDSRHWKIMRAGRDVIERRISSMLSRHSQVHVRVLRGNHDPHASLALSLALESRYREEERVTIEDPARDIFWYEWGRCLISGHHGDNMPARRLYELIADQCPFWSSTYHRYCFVGHGHHRKIEDFGGLHYEMLDPFCPPDAYSANLGYAQRRAIHSMTFHKQDGLVARVQDPIARRG